MSLVARRYAKAIFSLAQDGNEVEAVGQQLSTAAALLAVPEIGAVLASPLEPPAKRAKLLESIAAELKLGAQVNRFLHFLSDRRRLDELGSIARQYQKLEDDALGRVRLTIRSAAPLADAEREQISAAFGRALERTPLTHLEVEPSLIGGVVVEAESTIYDGSVRTQLTRLTRRLAGTERHA